MAVHKPLVLIGGVPQQLPANDSLSGALPTSPGPGYTLMTMPEGGVDWVELITLPDMSGIRENGSGNWYKNVQTGPNGAVLTPFYESGGVEPWVSLQPSTSISDGRFFRTADMIRIGVTGRRFTTWARKSLPVQFSSSSYIRTGWGFVNGEDSNGDSAPPSGGNWAAINFDRTPGNVAGIYATIGKNNTESRTLLVDNAVTGRAYVFASTVLANGQLLFQAVDTVTKAVSSYTETSATVLPANTTKFAIGGWARRMTNGGNAEQGRLFGYGAYKYST